ncbi:hypothetical protein G3A43_06715 [Paraburkholderia aspalathi]|nr:hypothetical protein [Paraburkholderia aspalathi]MBK3779942.1 hypothetical protein [Paraburkholderia aspalathi]
MSKFNAASASFATRGLRPVIAPLAAGVLLVFAAGVQAAPTPYSPLAQAPSGPPPSLVIDQAAAPAPTAPAPAPAANDPAPAAVQAPGGEPAAAGGPAAGTNAAPAAMPAYAVPGVPPMVSAPTDDVPWTLTPDQHPWPLRYRAPAPVTSLYLDLPSPADTKLEMPGVAADQADAARIAVNRYFANLLAEDNRVRGGQLDALNTWLDRAGPQEQSVGADPWARYEFSSEALRQVIPFRAGVAGQSAPESKQVLEQVRAAVVRISPLVQLMPTYETRLAWYNVLVQLKEGLTQYQSQSTDIDQKLLASLDGYLASHPEVPRPAGEVPQKPTGFARTHPAPAASGVSRPDPQSAAISIQGDTHKPAAMPPERKQSSSLLGSALIALFGAGTLGWVVLKIRGRNKGGLKVPAAVPKK